MSDDIVVSACSMESGRSRASVERAVKPRTLSGGIRKLGIALVAAPDPVTGIPGAALLATSVVMRRREPAGTDRLAAETRKLLREIETLRI
jgi:hypothetical protein